MANGNDSGNGTIHLAPWAAGLIVTSTGALISALVVLFFRLGSADDALQRIAADQSAQALRAERIEQQTNLNTNHLAAIEARLGVITSRASPWQNAYGGVGVAGNGDDRLLRPPAPPATKSYSSPGATP